MAYKVKGKNGLPIKKDGEFVLGYDIPITKIEQMDEINLTFLAIGSTETEDRDKDIIRVSGWDVKNFKKNPVVPWGHNYYAPPIAKALTIKKDLVKKRLVFKPQFDANDPNAVMIFNKYRGGFLTSFSVGFMGKEFKWRDEDNKWWGGREYTKQELLEISCVTVPANPDANVEMRSFSLEVPPSLVQMGYKNFFAKTDSGLFYPVKEMELYTQPREIELGNGVKAISATPIDDPEAKHMPVVGYIFDESVFDDDSAVEWVRSNAPTKQKISYFDMKTGDTFEFDLKEEQVELGIFEKSIEITEKEFEEVEEIELTEEDIEKYNSDEIEEISEEIEEKNTPVEEEPIQDPVEAEGDKETVKIKVDASEIKSVLDNFLHEFTELIKSGIGGGTKGKKSVEISEEVNENIDVVNSDTEVTFELEESTSKEEQQIELDLSVLTPDSKDESNSEVFFEIDEEDLRSIGKSLNESSADLLKNKITEVFKSVLAEHSGKIS